MDRQTLAELHAARAAEKAQTLFYRALSAAAEEADRPDLTERLNQLLADEQHHLSRLTARLIEMGESVGSLAELAAPEASLESWEDTARERERAEIARYEALLQRPLDAATAELVREALRVERQHESNLAGKWTAA